jgi:DNA-binding transcriptional ArsR family regulator
VTARLEPLTDEMLEEVAERFRLLGEPLRLRLLLELEGGARTVNELAEATGAGQPNVSRHLMSLFNGGLLYRRREGVKTFYAIADPVVFRLCDLVCRSTVKHMESRLASTVGRRRK